MSDDIKWKLELKDEISKCKICTLNCTLEELGRVAGYCAKTIDYAERVGIVAGKIGKNN